MTTTNQEEKNSKADETKITATTAANNVFGLVLEKVSLLFRSVVYSIEYAALECFAAISKTYFCTFTYWIIISANKSMKSDRPIRMKQAVREIERQGERERDWATGGERERDKHFWKITCSRWLCCYDTQTITIEIVRKLICRLCVCVCSFFALTFLRLSHLTSFFVSQRLCSVGHSL